MGRRSFRIDIASSLSQLALAAFALGHSTSVLARRESRSMTGLRSGCVLTPLVPLAIRLAGNINAPDRPRPLARHRPESWRREDWPRALDRRASARPLTQLARKTNRGTARGAPTNGRRPGVALFERELQVSTSASSRSARGGRRTFDRRDELRLFGRAVSARQRDRRPGRSPGKPALIDSINPLNKYEERRKKKESEPNSVGEAAAAGR
jgi:hypothetical protein